MGVFHVSPRPMVNTAQLQVETVTYFFESIFDRIARRALTFVYRDCKQRIASMAGPHDLQSVIDNLESFLPRNSFPRPFFPSGNSACVNLNVLMRAEIQRIHEFIDAPYQMKYLALEYGYSSENKMRLRRVFDRSGSVNIKKIQNVTL